jgi:hypothetical protein
MGSWRNPSRIWSGLSESNRHLNLGKVRLFGTSVISVDSALSSERPFRSLTETYRPFEYFEKNDPSDDGNADTQKRPD